QSLGEAPERRELPVRKPWETDAEEAAPDTQPDDPAAIAQLIALNADDPDAARKSVRARRADLIAQFAARQDQPDDTEPDPDSVAPIVDVAAPPQTATARARPITKPLSPGFASVRIPNKRQWPIGLVLLLALCGAGAALILASLRYYGAATPEAVAPYRPAVPVITARAPFEAPVGPDPAVMRTLPENAVAQSTGPIRRLPALLPDDLALADDGLPFRDIQIVGPVAVNWPETALEQPAETSPQPWSARSMTRATPEGALPIAMTMPGAEQPPICAGCESPGLAGLAGVDVVLHLPNTGARQHDKLREALSLAGAERLREQTASIPAQSGQVRYYDADQAETARSVARLFGGKAVDLTWYRPRPETRRIDIWVPGES
ncbi:MAG: hypothetical protein VXW58_14435, partial [Pseudomonadota bacterium]|nr:hypothetical protein [Pseudomonadota bacterium]